MLGELQAEKERGPPSPPWPPPPPRARAALGAVPRTSCSQSYDLTTRSCFLLKFCKSTSVRQVPVGCDGLLGKLWASTSWGPGGLTVPLIPAPWGPPNPPAALTSGHAQHPLSCKPRPSAFASAELHPLPTGNFKGNFLINLFIAKSGTAKWPGTSSPHLNLYGGWSISLQHTLTAVPTCGVSINKP